MPPPKPNHPWYHITPARFFIGLLVMQVLLFLSERFQWLAFNQHKGWTVLIAVGVVGVAMLVMLVWGLVCLLLRRRFQFSFRSLLVFLVALSVSLGWFAWELEKARRQREAVEAIWKKGGWTAEDYLFEEDQKMPCPPWLYNLLGEAFFCNVVMVSCEGSEIGDKDVKHLKKLADLERLYLSHTEITDKGLEHLRSSATLKILDLTATDVSETGVEKLQRELPNCKIIYH